MGSDSIDIEGPIESDPIDLDPIDFPFTDQSVTKKRPAVVIGSRVYNRERPDLIIMAVTSQIKPASTIRELAVREWQAAGLLKPSAIKPVIATIEKALVIKTLGHLKADDKKALRKNFDEILGGSESIEPESIDPV